MIFAENLVECLGYCDDIEAHIPPGPHSGMQTSYKTTIAGLNSFPPRYGADTFFPG